MNSTIRQVVDATPALSLSHGALSAGLREERVASFRRRNGVEEK